MNRSGKCSQQFEYLTHSLSIPLTHSLSVPTNPLFEDSSSEENDQLDSFYYASMKQLTHTLSQLTFGTQLTHSFAILLESPLLAEFSPSTRLNAATHPLTCPGHAKRNVPPLSFRQEPARAGPVRPVREAADSDGHHAPADRAGGARSTAKLPPALLPLPVRRVDPVLQLSVRGALAPRRPARVPVPVSR